MKLLFLSAISVTLFAGCGSSQPTHELHLPEPPPAFDINTIDAMPEVQRFLLELQGLVELYNRVGNGIELSEHGISAQLSEKDAQAMASNANKLLNEINAHFRTPVCKPIGATWYQVPSQFGLAVRSEADAYNHACFTISHHNCGLHEFDFLVTDGIGNVVADRYDSLGIAW